MLENVLLILHLKKGPNIIETVSSYKYLGLILDEFLLYDMAVETLCSSAGRALGAVISKSRSLRNFGYKTYTKLFNSCVTPIYEYGAATWKEKKYPRCNNIFNRALRFFSFCTQEYTISYYGRGYGLAFA